MSIDKILTDLLSTEMSSDTVKIARIANECPDGIKKLIQKDFSEIREEDFDPDQVSSYNDRFTEGKNHLRTTNWSSSSSTQWGYYLSTQAIASHFKIIFEKIASIYNSELEFMSMVLCRNNLFHGHVLYNETLKDIFIVFHAFEYPCDLEPQKSSQAKEIEPGIDEYDSEAIAAFAWRNAIYSVNNNCVYIPDISQEPYCSQLRRGPAEYCTLDETKVGTRLFDINYFPEENLPSFSA